jgi:hypothetical protein
MLTESLVWREPVDQDHQKNCQIHERLSSAHGIWVGHPAANLGLKPSYGVGSYSHLLRKCTLSDPTVDSVSSKACDVKNFIQTQEAVNAFCFSHHLILIMYSILAFCGALTVRAQATFPCPAPNDQE